MKKATMIILVLATLLFAAGCIHNGSQSNTAGREDKVPADAPYRNPLLTADKRVRDLLPRMTLDEKIGQMTQVAKDFLLADSNIANYFIGSVLSGGGMGPSSNTPEAWADMYDGYQRMALSTRLGIPILYGIDAVHGNNTLRGAVVFPHNIGMGCTRNPALAEDAARITAIEVAATGVDWTFAPCIAVPRDERWGRTYEGFGETPELAEMMAAAEVRGFQGAALGEEGKILACAKHFLADGGTLGGRDQGDAVIDEATLRKIHLPGYVKAIEAGTGTIMASFSSWNGEKMHGNKYLLTDVLKKELGFSGFLVSDWKAIDQLPMGELAQVYTSINSGLDMIMVPDNFINFIQLLRTSVNEGKVTPARIDDAVARILTVKFRLGLFEKPFADRSLIPLVGSPEHRKVGRECVRQSVVLLKNEGNILPLARSLKRIHVAGNNANNIGSQCGGWTMTWQGAEGDITTGTSVLDAIRKQAPAGTEVTYSYNGSDAKGADVGIAVIGETPYAEFKGDATDLSISVFDRTTIKNMTDAGVPVVVVLISGRPMIVTDEIAKWKGFLAAWLPGTEAGGIADIVFGAYNPTGKLSHTWPKSMKHIPINHGDAAYDPLFPYGFGLSYPTK